MTSLDVDRAILARVLSERRAQEVRYGHVNDLLQHGSGPDTRWLGPFTHLPAVAVQKVLRREYEEFEDETGHPTWVHLVLEEICEAFEIDADAEPERLAEELIQVAALCVSWVRRLGVVTVPEQPSWNPDDEQQHEQHKRLVTAEVAAPLS